MSGTSLALKIGSLILGLGALLVLFKKVKGLKKYGWSSLFYVLVVSLLMASSGFFLYLKPSTGEIYTLLMAQVVIIGIGMLHVFLAHKLLPWYPDQVFGMQIIFIICMLLFGYFFFNLSFTFFIQSDVEIIWYLSLLWFLVPVLLNQTIIKLLEVPPKEYKKWQYPVGETIEDPTDEEMENPVVISFVFKKSKEAPETTNFRAKAPLGMSLGRLFYFFINDYNSRHPESTISYSDENNIPNQWIFFKRKNKLLNLKTALDPDEAMYNCKINENDVLLCKRLTNDKNLKQNETTE
ncbi:MAG: TssN family type VI secretion system protein [Tangfeifania sp.]